jgi:hypothetical protein
VFRPVQRGVDLAAGEALASRVRSLGDTPLVVITAARHDEWRRVVSPRLTGALDRLWTTMQDELASLSTDHVHVVAVRSDHFVQQLEGQPEVVTRAVREVVRGALASRRTFRRVGICSADPMSAAAGRRRRRLERASSDRMRRTGDLIRAET